MRSFLLICLLLLARSSNGQGSHAIAFDIEHQWLITSSSDQYGLQQVNGWLNVKNWDALNADFRGPQATKVDGVWGRWTNVWFGAHSFRVPLPAAAVACIGGLLFILFGWLLAAGCRWFFTRRGKNKTNAAGDLP